MTLARRANPFSTDRGAGLGAVSFAAVVCLVLIALLAVAQVAHFHTNASDADHCPVCIMLHSAAPVEVAAAVVVFVRIGMETALRERCLAARSCHSTVYIRPPPGNRQG